MTQAYLHILLAHQSGCPECALSSCGQAEAYACLVSAPDLARLPLLRCRELEAKHIVFTRDPDCFSPRWLPAEEAAAAMQAGELLFAFIHPRSPRELRYQFWHDLVAADLELGVIYRYRGRSLDAQEAASLLSQTWCRRIVSPSGIPADVSDHHPEPHTSQRVVEILTRVDPVISA